MPTSSSLNEDVKQHYTRPDLGTVILAAIASAGKDLDALKPEDLAPIDEFHISREFRVRLEYVNQL